METMILREPDGFAHEDCFQWVPDNERTWVVMKPIDPAEIVPITEEALCREIETELIVLDKKMILNDRYLCRAGWSSYRMCWLVSCYKTLWRTPHGVVELSGKVEHL